MNSSSPMSLSSDPTFSSYTNEQAREYAKNRGDYTDLLIEIIINHHINTGGNLGCLVDVGCGPGNSTRSLAVEFDHAIGLDPGVEMINTARENGGHTASGQPIKYIVSSAEDMAESIHREKELTTSVTFYGSPEVPYEESAGRVDLITAAMAAHWFNMPKFWAEAARILKPGGTVALWTQSSLYCHPAAPNAMEIQKALFNIEREVLAPFELPGNRLSRDCYVNLPLPWAIGDEAIANAFPEAKFIRMVWDRDGVLTDGVDFFGGADEVSLSEIADGLSTASMVTRWREAHADIAGTDQDCVTQAMGEVRKALGTEEGNPSLKVGSATILLLFKHA